MARRENDHGHRKRSIAKPVPENWMCQYWKSVNLRDDDDGGVLLQLRGGK